MALSQVDTLKRRLSGVEMTRQRLFEREAVFAYLLLAPAAITLLAFMVYPFCYGLWLSLNQVRPGQPMTFVGLGNFQRLLSDDVFRRVIRNTLTYALSAEAGKLALGLVIAHLLNRHFRFRTPVRALLLLPWIVPTVLSALAWSWIFDPRFGVLNWTLLQLGLIREPIVWLYTPPLPMLSVIGVNIWRSTPFAALAFLGAMQAIPSELYEAARMDGARAWQQFRYVTLPMLRPVILTVMLLSTIVTFADFQIIFILTGGGPNNQTQVFSTYAYNVGLRSGELGLGAAASLTMFPILSVLTLIILTLVRRDD